MIDRFPLLLFPSRENVIKSNQHGGGGLFHYPTHDRQVQRLSPVFSQLQRTLNQKHLRLVDNPVGLDPEEVIVLEIANDVDGFVNAVKRVEGLDWLGEYATEDLAPDDEFYVDGHLDRSFGGKVYLTASNLTAMNQLISLWELYSRAETGKFPWGLTKIKHVFEQLRSVRFWGSNDRLYPEDIDFWLECIEQNHNAPIRIEIELWYRGTSDKRRLAESSVEQLVLNVGGHVLAKCELQEIRYHSLLVEVPAGNMRDLLNNIDSNELVQNNNIMIFRPAGQQVSQSIEFESAPETHYPQVRLKDRNPRIAVLDGLPLENHDVIKESLIIDDPDDFTSFYSVQDRLHGTQMCSLVLRGDLSLSGEPIDTPIYVRPIMKPSPNGGEYIPDDLLLIDLVHHAIRRMKEGENGNPPSAPMVKVVNFSIGDPRRLFYRSMSPMARLLDWLSVKYDLLFIISSGNVSIPFYVESAPAFNAATRSVQSKMVFDNLLSKRSEARLIAPAESINNLTIGAVHLDSATISATDRRLNPFDELMPAIYTRIGSGYRKSIKPDMVCSGGRQLYNEVLISGNENQPSCLSREPGIKVAVPDDTRTKTSYMSGTSHAAALMSHFSASCINVLEDLGIADCYHAVMVKAMLAHGCSWDELEPNMKKYLVDLSVKDQKKVITQFIGYGYPEIEKSLFCNPRRATAIAIGDISVGEGHKYKFPLPPSLATRTTSRRLTVTLAWMSPIHAASQKYRHVKLWYETPDKMNDCRVGPDWRKVMNGTLQHEIFDGNSAQAFVDGDFISVKISCTKDASKYGNPIKYALMVSLEIKGDVDIPVYQEVSERITARVPIAQ